VFWASGQPAVSTTRALEEAGAVVVEEGAEEVVVLACKLYLDCN